MIPPGSVYVCASPAARKGKWRSLAGRSIDGPRYRDRVTIEGAFHKHGRLVLMLKEWPGESYFAEHFRPVQNHTQENDVAGFLPLLRGVGAMT